MVNLRYGSADVVATHGELSEPPEDLVCDARPCTCLHEAVSFRDEADYGSALTSSQMCVFPNPLLSMWHCSSGNASFEFLVFGGCHGAAFCSGVRSECKWNVGVPLLLHQVCGPLSLNITDQIYGLIFVLNSGQSHDNQYVMFLGIFSSSRYHELFHCLFFYTLSMDVQNSASIHI